ncbi:MAG: hypothetical protein V3T58_01360, partial [Candidatus Hydrothermarchaeales archaeon]
ILLLILMDLVGKLGFLFQIILLTSYGLMLGQILEKQILMVIIPMPVFSIWEVSKEEAPLIQI